MGGIMEQKKYFDKELFPTQTTYTHTTTHRRAPILATSKYKIGGLTHVCMFLPRAKLFFFLSSPVAFFSSLFKGMFLIILDCFNEALKSETLHKNGSIDNLVVGFTK